LVPTEPSPNRWSGIATFSYFAIPEIYYPCGPASHFSIPMRSGVASKSAPMDGGSPRTPRPGSAAVPACSQLPLPLRGGSIESLGLFLNLASDNDFVLVAAWLLGALRAGGPYPALAIAGEQGSAKTVLSKLLRALIDPSVAPVRALPRDERELFMAASNGHVLAFDNLSGLPPWLSDTLCRLTSGGALSTRRLFTDQDEILFAAARPVILNGIEDFITRPDLAD